MNLTWADILPDKPTPCSTPPRLPKSPTRDSDAAAKRSLWPRLDRPDEDGRPDEVLAFNLVPKLAALRGLSVEGCRLAAERGLLRFCEWKGRLCWAVTDGRSINAQVRRMSGKPWQEIGAKAWTLPGSRASWPLGVEESRRFPISLLVEGGPDILAAHHFAFAHRRQADAAVVGMLGAANKIPDDALPAFRGKRVRIMAHADEAGIRGAKTWRNQLRTVGAVVDAADFSTVRKSNGETVKDLNDAADIHPEDASQMEDLIP